MDRLDRRAVLKGAAALVAVGGKSVKTLAQTPAEEIRTYTFDEAVSELGFERIQHSNGESSVWKPRFEELAIKNPGTREDTLKWIGELQVLFRNDYQAVEAAEREAIQKNHAQRINRREMVALKREGDAIVKRKIWRDENGAISSFSKDRVPLFRIRNTRGVLVEFAREMRYATSERYPISSPQAYDEIVIEDESRLVGIALDREGTRGRVDFAFLETYSNSREANTGAPLFLTFIFDVRGNSVGTIKQITIQGLDRVERYCQVAHENGAQLSPGDFVRMGGENLLPDDPVYRGGLFSLKSEALEQQNGTSHLRGLLNYFLTLPLAKI